MPPDRAARDVVTGRAVAVDSEELDAVGPFEKRHGIAKGTRGGSAAIPGTRGHS